VASGLGKTLRILTETRNEAAVPALLGGLGSANHHQRADCLRALLDRRSKAGHLQILLRWHTFDDQWKSIVAEKASRLEGSLRAAILSTDTDLHQNACDAVVYLHGYDLIPTLITAAEDKGNTKAPLAARAVVSLCELLYHELHEQRDYRKRRDPVLVRQYIFAAIEKAFDRFENHRRSELVEAFLILARADDASLKHALTDQLSVVHAATTNALAHSQRPGVMHLLLKLLGELHAPQAILGVITRRSDIVFLRMMFRRFSQELTPQLKANLRKVDGFAWLRDDMSLLRDLTDEEMHGALQVILASGINRLRAFDVLQFVFRKSGPISRRTASVALASFKGNAANELVMSAVDDSDPEVQANAVRQLRDRGIPGVMSKLVELVDSPHEIVNKAARDSLSEFNFQRYLSAFEMLQPEVRRCSGNLVTRIDPNAVEELKSELASASRARRLRGIEIAIAMGVVSQVESQILDLAQDDDHFVRAEATRALIHTESPKSAKLLDELLNDRSASVQEAAQQAIEQLKLNRLGAPVKQRPPLPTIDSVVGFPSAEALP
jgi:hypothetical protein